MRYPLYAVVAIIEDKWQVEEESRDDTQKVGLKLKQQNGHTSYRYFWDELQDLQKGDMVVLLLMNDEYTGPCVAIIKSDHIAWTSGFLFLGDDTKPLIDWRSRVGK